jgi:hypothetical protein
MIEDLLDHHRIFDADDDFYGTAGLDLEVEYTSEPLRSCYRRSPLCRRWRFVDYSGHVAPAPPYRRH